MWHRSAKTGFSSIMHRAYRNVMLACRWSLSDHQGLRRWRTHLQLRDRQRRGKHRLAVRPWHGHQPGADAGSERAANDLRLKLSQPERLASTLATRDGQEL